MADNEIEIKIGEGDVKKGYAEIPVQIDSNIGNGEYTIRAVYSGDDYYAPSMATGLLRVGFKSYVHCPHMFVWDHYKTNMKLVANVFVGKHQASIGRGLFRVRGTYIDTATPLYITSGQASKMYNGSEFEAGNTSYRYGFRYNGSYDSKIKSRNINPAESKDARITIMKAQGNKNDEREARIYPVIEIDPVVGKPGETVHTTARVYNSNFGTVLDKSDIPYGKGRFIFWYEGMSEQQAIMASTPIDENGECTVSFPVPDYEEGGYNLYVKFVSYDKTDWATTYGATSLFVTRYDPVFDEPTLTIADISFNKGEQNAYITCKFNPPYTATEATIDDLTGFATLRIEDQIINLTNSNAINGRVPVTQEGLCEFQFSIPLPTQTGAIWVQPGQHSISVEYTNSALGETYNYNTDARLIIKKDTSTTILNIEDNDSIIYLPNNGDNTSIRVKIDDIDTQSEISEGNVLIKYVKTDVSP